MTRPQRWDVRTLGHFAEEDGVQLRLGFFLHFGPLAPRKSSPSTCRSSKQTSRLRWTRTLTGLRRECTPADGQCLFIDSPRTSSSFPKVEAERGGVVFYELPLGVIWACRWQPQRILASPRLFPRRRLRKHGPSRLFMRNEERGMCGGRHNETN